MRPGDGGRPRPLTAEFEKHIGRPEGGVVCRSEGKQAADNNRHFSFPGKGPAQVLGIWKAIMKDKGWVQTHSDPSKGPSDDHCTFGLAFEKGKMLATVSVSECEGRSLDGWSTVGLVPR